MRLNKAGPRLPSRECKVRNRMDGSLWCSDYSQNDPWGCAGGTKRCLKA